VTVHSQPPRAAAAGTRPQGPASLADVLERVLDKGVVIVGDIVVSVLDIELLTLKVRLLVASADTAQRMGIDWWRRDPFLNADAAGLEAENRALKRRLTEVERKLEAGSPRSGPAERSRPEETDHERA
jgi:hypothetical protein